MPFLVGSCYFWILVVLIRMQTSFGVVVSGFGLNVKQRTYSSKAAWNVKTSHSLLRPGMPYLCSGLWFFSGFFSVRLLSVLRGYSVFSSTPQRQMTYHFEGFSIPDFIHYIYFLTLILEKEPVFSVLNVQC